MSWVEVRLSNAGDGYTRLELEHLADPADIGEFWQIYGPGATGIGWDLAFLGLARHLASGAGMDPDEAERWTTSTDG